MHVCVRGKKEEDGLSSHNGYGSKKRRKMDWVR